MNRKRSSRGFTLIELTIVMFIIAVVMVIAIPKMEDTAEIRVRNALRRLSGTIRYVYDEAIFMKEPFIMRFDIKKGEYWIVVQAKPAQTLTTAQTQVQSKANNLSSGGENQGLKEEIKKDLPQQEEEKTVELVEVKKYNLMRKNTLPSNLKFTDVMTAGGGKKTEGIADTHFYVHGYIEPTIIHLEDSNKIAFSLLVNPLTGKVKIIEGYVEEEKK